jgi:hypothetical protein
MSCSNFDNIFGNCYTYFIQFYTGKHGKKYVREVIFQDKEVISKIVYRFYIESGVGNFEKLL